MDSSQKIGLFFGSFNPIHMGHMIIANLMVETYLGTFTFDAGTAGSVRLDNNGTTAVLIADAMIWRVPVDPPPVISAMKRQPEIVTASEPVTITAAITDNGSITSASLQYSVNPAAVTGAVAAFDDGAHGDGTAGDGIFGAAIPAQPIGSTVGYHIAAADDLGRVGCRRRGRCPRRLLLRARGDRGALEHHRRHR